MKFPKFLSPNNIAHKLTCVNTPQQNGVAKRKIHYFLDVARSLLFHMSIPKPTRDKLC